MSGTLSVDWIDAHYATHREMRNSLWFMTNLDSSVMRLFDAVHIIRKEDFDNIVRTQSGTVSIIETDDWHLRYNAKGYWFWSPVTGRAVLLAELASIFPHYNNATELKYAVDGAIEAAEKMLALVVGV